MNTLTATVSSRKILVVDDRPVDRDYYRTVLGYAGYEVLEAADGAEALGLACRRHPDLVLTDAMMPTMDGYALVQALRADPQTATTPVVFCTAAYREDEARELAAAIGVARFLAKPLEPQELLAAVAAVLADPAPVPAAPLLSPDEAERAHLRLLNDKLVAKMARLEAEIAARRRADEALRRRHEELETLMDAIPAMVFLAHDPACERITGNRAANALFGVPGGSNIRENLDGPRKTVTIRDAEQRECPIDELPMQRAAHEGRPVLGSRHCLHFADGREVWLLGNSVPLYDERGAVRGVIAAFTDISNLKLSKKKLREHRDRLEAQVAERTADLLAANKELQAFTYAASHDLKAPLGRINSFGALLEMKYRDRLEGEGLMFLDFIRQNARRMSDLIDDLLAHARIEKEILDLQPIDLSAAVQCVLKEKEEDIREAGAAIRLELPAVAVQAHAHGLAQALRNLVDNALKYAGKAEAPAIEIGAAIGGEAGDGRCRLWIRDNGVGFDMAYRDRIFELFRRLHTYDEYPGTGVGLALVRKAVERMGGKVWAESAPGAGATFFVELPLS